MATSKRKKVEVLEPDVFYGNFPNLNSGNHKPTSLATPNQDNPQKPYYVYNCFAFVVGDRRRLWWPAKYHHWPEDCHPDSETIEELAHVLATKFGYEECNNGDFEEGVEKVAIFAMNGVPTHVALQPSYRRGVWKSKMGLNVDIEHELNAVAGPVYGEVVMFMCRTARGKADREQKN